MREPHIYRHDVRPAQEPEVEREAATRLEEAQIQGQRLFLFGLSMDGMHR